jgi:hypothetical protein
VHLGAFAERLTAPLMRRSAMLGSGVNATPEATLTIGAVRRLEHRRQKGERH